ncbi:GyrI-like domain-containing protein, partial [Acinetobacter baumannii]|uniref:GyrI-like domain-containing protein n=1 Tax=Acinetobacter baumannii TaxID=470 RepID=UPI001AECE945
VYTVYPLEGIWTTTDGSKDENLNKDQLAYRIMIRQPEQVNTEIVNQAIQQTLKKKDNPYLNRLSLETYEDGKSIQMIHVGSFDTELESFKQMDSFLEETEYERDWLMESYVHREIYLSDARKVLPEKRKTVLRYK